MPKYEYTYLRVEGDFKKRLDELNAAGSEGWKVEGIEYLENTTTKVAFLMSRVIGGEVCAKP